jgi:hypothetical protein
VNRIRQGLSGTQKIAVIIFVRGKPVMLPLGLAALGCLAALSTVALLLVRRIAHVRRRFAKDILTTPWIDFVAFCSDTTNQGLRSKPNTAWGPPESLPRQDENAFGTADAEMGDHRTPNWAVATDAFIATATAAISQIDLLRALKDSVTNLLRIDMDFFMAQEKFTGMLLTHYHPLPED